MSSADFYGPVAEGKTSLRIEKSQGASHARQRVYVRNLVSALRCELHHLLIHVGGFDHLALRIQNVAHVLQNLDLQLAIRFPGELCQQLKRVLKEFERMAVRVTAGGIPRRDLQ